MNSTTLHQFAVLHPLAELAANVLLQSTLLLAAGLFAGRMLRRSGPAVQSVVYRTTLAAILLCPLAAWALAALGVDGLAFRLPREELSRDAVAAVEPLAASAMADALGSSAARGSEPLSAAADTRLIPTGDWSDPERSDLVVAPALMPPASSTPHALPAPPSPGEPPAAIAWPPAALLALLVVWLAASGVLLIRLAIGCRLTARLRRSAVPAGSDDTALCRTVAEQFGVAPPQVLRSPFLSGACLVGVWWPAVLLHEEDHATLRETLMHEIAHLARRDCLWNLLRRLATALLPLQPLAWMLSRRIERTAEEVCDDYVVAFGADRRHYAGLLLDVAERNLPASLPAGVGMISVKSLLSGRIVRILDASRALSTRVGWWMLGATLAVGVLGTLLAGLVGVGDRGTEALAEEPADTGSDASDRSGNSDSQDAASDSHPEKTTVTGRVVDADGRPLAGAAVTAARFRSAGIGPYGWEADREELARVTTGPDGSFSITFPALEPDDSQDQFSPDKWRRLRITASADRCGPAWIEPQELAEDEQPTLQLARDAVPITGRVVDLEGRPVPGVMIRTHWLWDSEGEGDGIDRWRKRVAEPKPEETETAIQSATRAEGQFQPRSHYFPLAGRGLPASSPHLPAPVLTDADGRFRIHGLGPDRLAILELSGPTAAFKRVQVVTRRMDRVEGRPLDEPGLGETGYHGADCTIVAEPSRPIEGTVRDADTGMPIAGAVVTAENRGGSIMSIEGLINAVTDKQGRYQLVGLPKGDGHELAVHPPLDQPYFVTQDMEVPPAPGLGSMTFDIELKRGIWITGRVTDKATGEPVQAAIHFYPYLSNEWAQQYPRNFRPNSLSANWTGNRHRTDTNGNYRVLGLPGRGIVAAKAFDRGYRLGVGADDIAGANERGQFPTYNRISPKHFHALREVDVPEGAEPARLDLQLDPGEVLTVRLVDPQGQDLVGVRVAGQYPQRWGNARLEDPLRVSHVILRALESDDPRRVMFLHEERRLGAVLTPSDLKQDDREFTLTLRPWATVTGRLVDAEGRPVAGRIEIGIPALDRRRGEEIEVAELPTDAEGRFRYELLPPDGPFYVFAHDPSYGMETVNNPRRFKGFLLTQDLQVEPGQVADLGAFDVTTGKRVADEAKRATSLRGRVLDSDGNPVKQAQVIVRRDTEPHRPKTTTTQADGRFAVDLAGNATPDDLLVIAATADGLAMGWSWGRLGSDESVLMLPPVVPITGRIIDLEGRPVPGATVKVTQVVMPRDGLDDWLAAVRLGAPPWVAHSTLGEWTTQKTGFPDETQTDADGRNRIDGIGAERLVDISVHGPTAAHTSFRVVTRPQEPIDWRYRADFGTTRVYGPDFTHTVAPARTIRGLVRDAESGEPLGGVDVHSWSFAGTNLGGTQDLRTVTATDGRFELIGMPKGRGNRLLALPNDDQPYFMREVEVGDPPGLTPVDVTIELHRGLWIIGRVTDKSTGRPAPGMRMHYLPFLENMHAQALPEFDETGNVDGDQSRYTTNEDGEFRIVGLPGPAVVGVVWDNPGQATWRRGVGYETIAARYGTDERSRTGWLKTWRNPLAPNPDWPLSMQMIDPAEGTERFEVHLELDPGLSVPVRVIDPEGRPISGVTARGRTSWPYATYPQEPEFQIINLAPDETRTVMIQHEVRGLGKVVRVGLQDANGGPITIRLDPLATIAGRVVDDQGQAVAAATIRTDPQPGGVYSPDLPETATDAKGQFRIQGVPVGCDYRLHVQSEISSGRRYASKDVAVRPDEVTDVGDLRPRND